MTLCGNMDEILVPLARRTGYQDLRTLQFLHGLVCSIKPAHVLEFGTAFGASSAYMAAGAGNGLVVSIDEYSGDYAKGPDEVLESLKAFGLDKKVRLLKGNTHDASDIMKRARVNGKFDVLFMDADHSYSGLWIEYDEALPWLKKDHIVIVDDTHVDVLDVNKFIIELAMKYAFCVTIKDMHWGMAIFCTNSGQLLKVVDVIREVGGD